MIRFLKILGWTLLALLLLVAGSLIVAVRLLHPARLTPMIEAAANRYLNADFELGHAELKLSGTAPFLEIELRDLVVASRDIRMLPGEQRESLPLYADTLLTLDRLQGSINIGALLQNRIELGDVTFSGPGVNIVVVSENLNNFNILPPSESSSSSGTLPSISLSRFAILDSKPLRYYNHSSRSEMQLQLNSMIIDGESEPTYLLDISGAIPLAGLDTATLSSLPFKISGDIVWDPQQMQLLGLENFDFGVAMLGGRFDTHLNFSDNLQVTDFKLKLNPLPVDRLLQLLPADLLASLNLPDNFSTTAQPEIEVQIDRPYLVGGSDSIPHATLSLLIPPSEIKFERNSFSNFTCDLSATLMGNDLDLMTVDLRSLTLSGPAADIKLSATATNLMTDPLVEGRFDGKLDLNRLPRRVKRLFNGYTSGNIDAGLSFKGRPSMLAPGSYYRLSAAGDINGSNLYWLSADTANMVYLHHCKIHFGNQDQLKGSDNSTVQLLRATVEVDSVDVLHTQYSFRSTGLRLAAATKNQRRIADSTAITPLGGRLSIGTFDFRLLSDSISVRARNIDGNVAMLGVDGDIHRPLFDFKLNIDRLSTGNPDNRLMLSNADVAFRAAKLPGRRPPKEVTTIADSIKTAQPQLSLDSVYALAVEKYRHKRKGKPRVHAELIDDESEIIDWGTSKALRRLLLEWKVDGHVLSNRVSLFTPYFPMRNRIRNFNVSFNNDTIRLDNVEYKVGHSDFLLSGRLSNLRRGLTSRTHTQSVKANFDVLSDTIDINQLADLTFRGAAYAEKPRKESLHLDRLDSDDHDNFDNEIERYIDHGTDSMAPLLIPRNLEAVFNIKANNILYSDLALRQMGGSILVYDGAANLHNLHASSDIGAVSLSALYQAPTVNNLRFGFGMNVKRFDIHGFLQLVPAIDSLMPLIHDFNGIIDADIAATVNLHRNMDFDMPSLHAAINIEGDSLQFIDAETYHMLGKWLRFRDRQDNTIKHMSVEMVVDSSVMEIYPFVFDLDRYRIGVQGYNDLDMNFNYHIAVLKSPLPFKFGVTIKGDPKKYKVRLGGAKFNEKQAIDRTAITDTTRMNLVRQIENVFRRGVDNSRFGRLNIDARPTAASIDLNADTLTHADSLRFIREGLIPAPEGFDMSDPDTEPKARKSKSRKLKAPEASINLQHNDSDSAGLPQLYATLPRQRHAQGRPVRHGRHSV